MASKADESGPMSDLAQEVSRRVGEVSHWLANHEPADLLDEVKPVRPPSAGCLLGHGCRGRRTGSRVTRGAVAANTSVDSDRESRPARAYDSGGMTTRVPRRAVPRTALAVIRTGTTPPGMAISVYQQKPAIRVQTPDRPRHLPMPAWRLKGSTPRNSGSRTAWCNRRFVSERDTDQKVR
jgi:hypothetical protein